MKHKAFQFVITLFLTVFSATAIAGSGYENDQNKNDSIQQNKVIRYEVFGMDCPGCQSALEKQVKKIDGVSEAKASWQKKQVVVTLKPDAKVKEEEITARIKKANFTPGEKLKPEEDEE